MVIFGSNSYWVLSVALNKSFLLLTPFISGIVSFLVETKGKLLADLGC